MSDPRLPDGNVYRFRTPTEKGPWRDNYYAALLDAVRSGYGSVSEWIDDPGMPPMVFLHPFVRVTYCPIPAVARAA